MNNKDLEKEVKRLVHQKRYKKGYVCAIDVLLELGYLTEKDYKDWRFGRISYLEKVCQVNLSKLTLLNKLIAKYSKELELKKSWTAYNQHGIKGAKRRLRFSKSGIDSIEKRYATHHIDTKRIAELNTKSKNDPQI